jgi:RHS repeat-associated protein
MSKHGTTNKQPHLWQTATVARLLVLVLCLITPTLPAHAESPRTGLLVTVPNGYANIAVDDLRVESTAGTVRWMRVWDGQEWKFNPQWESLSQSWKNLTGSQSADTTGSTLSAGSGSTSGAALSSSGSGGGGGGCWVWVDEDWQPSTGTVMIGGIPEAGPMLPVRTTPFNRLMGEASADYPPPQNVSVDYASLCAGSSLSGGSTLRDAEGIRRINELYLGDAGRYAFNNRSILEKRSVRQLPTAAAAAQYAGLAAGSITLAPITNAKGYRWIDKGGDWIDYNTQGQVVAWGDKNDNIVWLVRDTDGVTRGVVDALGRVLFTLHYTGQLISEIKDYAAGANDLPARSVKYRYDANNRLTQVTDARGNVIKYDYDAGNRIVKITDQEGHAEQLAYSGDMVKQRTAPDGAVTDYEFEYDDTNKQFVSQITGPETAAGRRVEDYTHNRVSKLVRRIVNGRTEEEVRYDTGARAEINTNARGFATRITKNEFDQVVEVAHPDGAAQQRSYSALHLGLTEETDELGIKTQYQYDTRGNLTKKIEAAGTADERVTEYQLNSLGQTTQVTRKGRTEANGTVTPDATWQIEYDALGQISKTTDPEGNVRQYAYDRTGNLARFTDPRGNATRYDVDADGKLVKVTDALGRTRSYQYDKVGNVTQAIDARAKVYQAAYDAMNRRLQTTNPVGGAYKLQYNGQGLPIAETDEDGRTSRAEFDNFLRLTKQIDGLGNATEYSYNIPDGSGTGTLGALYDPTETKYPTFTQRSRYDQRERPTNDTLLNPNSQGTEGLVSSTEYDKRGQVKSEADANGKTRFYRWDAIGQLIETTDSLGNKTKAQYDARGNLIQILDAKGNVNKFEFDRNDRVVKEILPLGQTTTYQYDEAGNLKERVDPNGYKIVYGFDAVNRLTDVKQYKAGNVLTRTTTYTWDAADNLTAWSDIDHGRNQTASASATFDDANRKTGETITYPAGNTLSYGYAYSAAGYKTQLTWPDGTAIGYGYSAHGELESITIPGEGSISVNQFKWFAPAKITLPGGSTQERTLDGLLNLEGLKVKTPGQQTVLSVANTYGKVQELKTSNRTDTAGNVSTTKNGSYTYDDETRLTQATTDTGGLFGTDTESFTLDAVGNRIAHSKVSGAWTYDANNRLIQRGTGANATTYAYDEAGNLTQKTEPGNKVTQYGYDTQNRLIEVKDGANNLIARYGYDPMDRRLWKEQYRDKGGNALSQAKRTTYLYADEGLIAEASQDITLNADQSVTTSGSPTIATQYGPRPDAEFTTGMLFVKTNNSNGQDAFAYYHHDQIGTPIQATDKAGSVVWAASYNVFGQASITTPNPTADKPTITSSLRLPGQIEDAETGMHYNYRRYYDPSTGRYITQDPIGLAGGDNPYRYVEANPVNLSDPTGECPQCAAFAVCMAACALTTAAENAITGECNNWGNTAKNCAIGCAAGMGLGWAAGKAWGWGKKAVGPLQNWFRFGPSYSKSLGQPIAWSFRWGASPAKGGKYIQQIGSPTLQNLNQSLRNQQLPFGGWRSADPGHFHIWK